MRDLLAALVIPIVVIAFVVGGVVGIGTILLSVGHDGAITVALALTTAVVVVATVLAARPTGSRSA